MELNFYNKDVHPLLSDTLINIDTIYSNCNFKALYPNEGLLEYVFISPKYGLLEYHLKTGEVFKIHKYIKNMTVNK
ncbi:MAG: hypothetical protein JXR36_15045 [Bacteroidales bacterium]|nr:hypothetical protein [Bacteroidales bacterium]